MTFENHGNFQVMTIPWLRPMSYFLFAMVRSGPVPVWGNKAFNISEISRIYVHTELVRSRGNDSYHSYSVRLDFPDGKSRDLLSLWLGKEEVSGIANELQYFLGNNKSN